MIHRKSLVNLEKFSGEMVIRHTFIVSDMMFELKQMLALYFNLEKFIKEGKTGFEVNHMSNTSFVANKNKLQISMPAYNFNNWFQMLCMAKR
ncbi:transposase [Zhenhengia yiwuensis]|uniref:Transposase n=1 Tax=Zhenhengia yiwuensis TaxID=2763666 RepID=A0A926EJB8_9FIRM|nr:transposase [Zhenhengia yiwuensis]MBC8580741.1 transposase [Zhenhengia yiwuensis]